MFYSKTNSKAEKKMNKSEENYGLNEQDLLQYKIQKCHMELYKQFSIKSTKHVKKNDFHLKLNRFYSKILVNYHWLFLLSGVLITCTLTGLSFLKQPLPSFLDPRRGFGARGEGTLTSQLIVMKNINIELTKYNKNILDLYEKIKKENRSQFDENSSKFNDDFNDFNSANNSYNLNYDDSVSDPHNEQDYDNEDVDKKDEQIDDSKRHLINERSLNDNLEFDDELIWKKYHGKDIRKMLNPNLVLKNYPKLLSVYENCNFSLGLEENLEYYFSNSKFDIKKLNQTEESEENLLNFENIKSLCKWDKKMLDLLKHKNKCYISLPFMIALLSDKSDCSNLVESDVKNFVHVTHECLELQKAGLLNAFSEEYKQKPEIIQLLNKNNLMGKFIDLEDIKQNLCIHKNLFNIIFEQMIDKNYLLKNENNLMIRFSNLIVSNQGKIYDENFLFDFYMNKFHSKKFDDGQTKIIALNLAGVRQEAAMRILGSEMSLVALAITLIVIVTLFYLRSIFISMIVNLGVAMSVGVAFFAYRIVFDIDLFPFINMMAAFLLIGIACDDVYVLFDAWYNEKARIIMEDLPDQIEKQYTAKSSEEANSSESNIEALPPIFIKNKYQAKSNTQNSTIEPLKNSTIYNELVEKGIDINEYTLNPGYVRLAPLTDDQMVRVMGGTLHHAASSIFVTSFTTSAAFLTNFITKLPYVQLFGFFAGSCILIYFLLVITMVSAFVITYEKHIQPYRCKITTKFSRKVEEYFEKAIESLALFNNRIISEKLPNLLIKFRLLWFFLFLLLGIGGMLIVFYEPKLKPPSNWKFQFFKTGNLFENFEFKIKEEFWFYANEEKRNYTNPEIFFVFGIKDKDTGRVFNPDDDGHLIYDSKFDFFDSESQIWLNNFINNTLANRKDLFLGDEIVSEWKQYLISMQSFCWQLMNIPDKDVYSKIFLPYDKQKLIECQNEIQSLLLNSTVDLFEQLMASFPRRIIFMSTDNKVNGLILRVNANRTFIDYYAAKNYYLELKKFHEENFSKAPEGFNSAWFISVSFALYDLQYQLITGTYSSLVTSMIIALIILLMTSGNFLIALFAIITISFSIADTIAIFVLLGWDLSVLESVIIIMSVGLSVDFSCHYGVAYINSDRDFNSKLAVLDNNQNQEKSNKAKQNFKFLRNILKSYKHNNIERFIRINDIFKRVGSAVLMAAFTTFLAGSSMYPSELTSFGKMGQFLMLVMLTSYLYATFFFVPLCALLGPTKNFGNLRFKHWGVKILGMCFKNRDSVDQEEVNLEEQVKLNENSPDKPKSIKNGLLNSNNSNTSNL